MKLYRTTNGIFVEQQDRFYRVPVTDWDELIRSANLHDRVQTAANGTPTGKLEAGSILAPIVIQEVWAAGVTYFRSRSARIEESKDAGGGDFYDRVYSAKRPEL